ncbi:2-C-methyl-D-erythritol 4-phosphate cytidylyltransferase [Anaerotruncus sp. CAG:390]|nr:2-C-methyl-D-erythritol 4-phosphate cytidylyltransferase [Anaerotruncus sp. CAG:390]
MNHRDKKKFDDAADILRTVIGKTQNRRTAAIIVAAGSSERMGGTTPKQFLPLCGMPVVAMTIRAYEDADCINDIIIVIRPGDEHYYDEYREKFGFTKIRALVHGGATRQESVMNGIQAADDGVAFFAIADAARPLTTPDIIRSVCLAAYKYSAATAATPAVDSIKTADERGFISATVERSTVWQVQTPQVFGANLYRAAAYTARDEGFAASDDNSLVEHIGYKVRLVDCGRENIKITTECDIPIAEAIINFRRANKAEAGTGA